MFNVGNIFTSIEHALIGSMGTDIAIPAAAKDVEPHEAETPEKYFADLADLAHIPDYTLETFALEGADLEAAKKMRDELAAEVAVKVSSLVGLLRTQVPQVDNGTGSASEPASNPEQEKAAGA